jgi:Flp pilus assembly pilin Flp
MVSFVDPRRVGVLSFVTGLAEQLWRQEEGQDLVEYGLLLVLLGLTAIASMQTIGSAISNMFSNAANNLASS